MVVLLDSNTTECDQNLPVWLCVHLVFFGLFAMVSVVSTGSGCLSCFKIIILVGEICILLWGIIILGLSESCKTIMPSVYNLVLAQLIIIPIFILIDIIVTGVSILIFCGILVAVLSAESTPINQTDQPYIYDQV